MATSGVITFTTGFDNDYYQTDSTGRYAYLYVEAKLAKLINLVRKRTPLNISIVIDRSGSMHGVKMGYAKKAAKAIIDQMEAEDYVSIVMYDNAIDSVQEPIAVVNKEMIKEKIDHISARGSTNLWGGTDRGYQYVLKNYKPGYINRVLLISDGLANVGITDSLKIRQNVLKYKDNDGISLSTFGVGLDYNESLMTDMAETGAGNYYYIDAPDHMMGMFDKELNGMLSVVAQDAELQIRLPKGLKVERSFPLNFTVNGDLIIIRMRDLFAEETKGTLLTLRIQDRMNVPLKCSTTLSYIDVMDGSRKKVTNENLLLPMRLREPYLTHFNKPVIQQAILLTANENLDNAMLEVDRGNFNGAKKLLDVNRSYLKEHESYEKDYHLLKYVDSVNYTYAQKLPALRTMYADSLKKFQKFNKAVNYRRRNKKVQ